MSVIAVTLSDRMQRIRISVRNLYRFSDRRERVVSGKRMLKNTVGQADKNIEDFRTTLLDLHKCFLDEAAITTEITALQILDNVGIISATVGRVSIQLNGMATQLKWVSSQVSDVGT